MIFIALPLVGALIGWITNYIAIRLLFRPLQPVKLPLLKIAFQGLIPKRRSQIADKVAQVVDEQLFSMDEIADRLDMPMLQKEVDRLAREVVGRWCEGKMGLLPGALRQYCSSYMCDTVAAELAAHFPHMATSLLSRMQEQVDVKKVVAEKINNLALDEVEQLVLDVARRELKQIERLGAVLGFVIGLVQSLIFYLLKFT
ncbi:MAG: DUF445 family protein [Dethiobacter sp.]|jgi:uncharacterized membrane protein YheB (UPF0754 family)|nr:DUF445 family protein [Dethiobacter sp.]